MKYQYDNPIFMIRISTENGYTIEVEKSASNEYHALLMAVVGLADDLNLNFYTGDFTVDKVFMLEE